MLRQLNAPDLRNWPQLGNLPALTRLVIGRSDDEETLDGEPFDWTGLLALTGLRVRTVCVSCFTCQHDVAPPHLSMLRLPCAHMLLVST